MSEFEPTALQFYIALAGFILTFIIATWRWNVSQNKRFDRLIREVHSETNKLRDFITEQNNQLRVEFRGEIKEVRNEIKEVREEIKEMRKEIANLDSRLSGQEGLLRGAWGRLYKEELDAEPAF